MQLIIKLTIMNIFKDFIIWISDSNRYKHLLYGVIIGLLANSWYSANYAGVFVAGAMELKDKLWGGKPDFVDFILTVIGFNIGYLIRFLIIDLWLKL